MPVFLKMGDLKGEVTDMGHEGWIHVDSFNSPITRTIARGAKDQERSRGDTTLHDIEITRKLDRSSAKLFEACVNGAFHKEVEMHFCTTVKGKQEPYLKYLLKNVIVSKYELSGSKTDHPTEDVSFAFSEIHWTYILIDSKTGEPKGNVPTQYNPNTGE